MITFAEIWRKVKLLILRSFHRNRMLLRFNRMV